MDGHCQGTVPRQDGRSLQSTGWTGDDLDGRGAAHCLGQAQRSGGVLFLSLEVNLNMDFQEFTVAMESGDALNEYASWNSLIKMVVDDTITVTHSTDSQLPLRSITLCVSSEIL